MNYRHAFHAGNFADCFKHALLITLVDALARKTTPFFVLDTHAGAGRYNLNDERSRRTAESDAGIYRLLQSRPPRLHRYIQLVESLGVYPGSPLLIKALLRSGDRLSCCELHPEDVKCLQVEFDREWQVNIYERSGWEALGSMLPPKERRGLVFLDPPFENPDEFLVLADGLARGYRRFAHGVFAAWYPIKGLAPVRRFHNALRDLAIRNIITVEFCRHEPADPSRLNGCGVLVINPPFGFAELAGQIGDAMVTGLGLSKVGARSGITVLSNE